MNQYRIQHPGFYALTLFSLTILLMLTWFFLAASFLAQRYTTRFQEEVKLVVEMKTGAMQEDRDSVIRLLKSAEGVLASSIEFISKEQALEDMRREMSDDVVLSEMENPFTDMIRFAMDAGHFNSGEIDQLKGNVEALTSVLAMHHPAGLFDPVFALLKRVQVITATLILILLLLCAILIHHIMRLNILSQRKQIRTMQLVGGHPAFIRKPYLGLAVKMALTAWAAAGLICVGIAFLVIGVSEEQLSPLHVTLGSLILLVLAIGVCVASTWVAVTRVLNQES